MGREKIGKSGSRGGKTISYRAIFGSPGLFDALSLIGVLTNYIIPKATSKAEKLKQRIQSTSISNESDMPTPLSIKTSCWQHSSRLSGLHKMQHDSPHVRSRKS
jgi:hypothetical protein